MTGLIITFESSPTIYHDAASFVWDFLDLEKKGLLKVVMTQSRSPAAGY